MLEVCLRDHKAEFLLFIYPTSYIPSVCGHPSIHPGFLVGTHQCSIWALTLGLILTLLRSKGGSVIRLLWEPDLVNCFLWRVTQHLSASFFPHGRKYFLCPVGWCEIYFIKVCKVRSMKRAEQYNIKKHN